jgi:hypothetical protein
MRDLSEFRRLREAAEAPPDEKQNGPPLFARIFSSESATARCMNICSVMTKP